MARTIAAPTTGAPADDAAEHAGLEKGNPELVAVVDQCRALYTNSLFSEKTQKAYEEMLQELALEGDIGKIRDNIHWLHDAIEDANQSEKEFAKKLEDAVKSKWISAASKAKWLERFKNFEGFEFERKFWVREHFDVFVNNWKEAAQKRAGVLELAAHEGVTAKEVPELWAVQTDEVFLELHYRNRKQSVAAARAAILARKLNLQSLHLVP